MSQQNDRSLLPDVVRGFAILLVILGHCIQEGSGLEFSQNAFYFQDKVYQLLYSFHMPLFMLISGYLAWNSVDRASKREERILLIKRRCSHLLIPIIGWGTLDYGYAFIINRMKGYQQTISEQVINFVTGILTNLWFLWAVLICFFVVCIMHYLLQDSIVIYSILFFLMFITPDGLGLGVYKYMMPYYLIAFYYHKYEEKLQQTVVWNEWLAPHSRYLGSVLLGLGTFFIAFVCFFEEKHFIYLTGIKILGKNVTEQLMIDGYRFIAGLVGSFFFLLLCRALVLAKRKTKVRILSVKVLLYLGERSLGIYILSGYIIMYLIRHVAAEWNPNYAINVLECVIVVFLSVLCTNIIRRIPILKCLVGEK